MNRHSLILFALALIPLLGVCQEAATAEYPEVLHLQNGDRISAFIQRFDASDNSVVLKSEQIGEFKIAWSQIKHVESSRVLYFRMENGNIVGAKASGTENGLQVFQSPMLGKFAVPRDQILMVGLDEHSVTPEFLALQAEQEATKEALRKATEIGEIWTGYIEAHFSGNEGNKNTRFLGAVGHMERKTDADRFVAHIDIRYAESKRVRSENSIAGYLKEDIDVTDWLYLWGQLSGEWDQIKGIDLRFRAEIGVGFHLLHPGDFHIIGDDKIALRWEIGAQFTNTDYDTSEDTHTGGAVTRVIYEHIFLPPWEEETPDSRPWTLEIVGEYYQSFVEPQNKEGSGRYSDYTLKGKVSLNVPVTGILSLTIRIWDEYSNVTDDPTFRRNDFYWDLGIRITI